MKPITLNPPIVYYMVESSLRISLLVLHSSKLVGFFGMLFQTLITSLVTINTLIPSSITICYFSSLSTFKNKTLTFDAIQITHISGEFG